MVEQRSKSANAGSIPAAKLAEGGALTKEALPKMAYAIEEGG